MPSLSVLFRSFHGVPCHDLHMEIPTGRSHERFRIMFISQSGFVILYFSLLE